MLLCIILFVLIPYNFFHLFFFDEAFAESSWESPLIVAVLKEDICWRFQECGELLDQENDRLPFQRRLFCSCCSVRKESERGQGRCSGFHEGNTIDNRSRIETSSCNFFFPYFRKRSTV
jgi:hypothetical protein